MDGMAGTGGYRVHVVRQTACEWTWHGVFSTCQFLLARSCIKRKTSAILLLSCDSGRSPLPFFDFRPSSFLASLLNPRKQDSVRTAVPIGAVRPTKKRALFHKNILATSAVSLTKLGLILIFASCYISPKSQACILISRLIDFHL